MPDTTYPLSPEDVVKMRALFKTLQFAGRHFGALAQFHFINAGTHSIICVGHDLGIDPLASMGIEYKIQPSVTLHNTEEQWGEASDDPTSAHRRVFTAPDSFEFKRFDFAKAKADGTLERVQPNDGRPAFFRDVEYAKCLACRAFDAIKGDLDLIVGGDR